MLAVLGVALLIWASAGDGRAGAGAGGADAASASAVPRPRTDRFDAPRAFALLRAQVVEYGWRPAGSPALRRLAVRLRELLPRGRFEAVPGHPGLRNVVGSVPGRAPAVVVAAHYDVEARPRGFVGANDGAAGTAAVLELARAMRAQRGRAGSGPAREVRFVLFDGEEEPVGCPDGEFYECALRGSKAYAERHAEQVHALVLLDYIAEKGTRIPQEGTSDPELWAQLRAAARRVGTEAVFPDLVGPGVIDDHTPFLRRDVPAIDLIDFDYPVRDTPQDDMDAVSERSLDAVGETVLELLTRLRRG